MKRRFILLIVVLITACGPKQPETASKIQPVWKPTERVTKAHLRGMHVLSETVAWASGTEGTVLTTTNGETWRSMQIPSGAELDFRDIEAFSAQEAIVMSSGNGVAIYRTSNGGKDWINVYSDSTPEVFFDGFDFLPSGLGVAYGDPVDGRMAILTTTDHGKTWSALPENLRPVLDSNEAGYAASGTGVVLTDTVFYIATGGGPKSRIFEFDLTGQLKKEHLIPIESNPGSGIFSICSVPDHGFAAVGGSYLDSTNARSNCAILQRGSSWLGITVQNPRGYRSCVASNDDGSMLVAVGRTGSDLSYDGGLTWRPMGNEGYFTCDLHGTTGWAAGRNGKMAKLSFD